MYLYLLKYYKCTKHGGPRADHTEGECRSRHKDFTSRKGKYLGNKNVPHKATTSGGNSRPFNPCTGCAKQYYHGHHCKKRDNKGQDHTVLAVQANNNISAEQIDIAMDWPSEDDNCKNKQKHNERNPFKLTITPIMINDVELIAKVDTGSDVTCINKYILDKHFKNTQINKINGSLNFLSLDNNKKGVQMKRVEKTEPLHVKYAGGLNFDFTFEVVEFNNDVMETSFDILLGTDILPNLRISLSGVAHCFPDKEGTQAQFKNIIFDTTNKYDPENANFGSETERQKFMEEIQIAIDNNKGAFCTMPEAQVQIPLKSKTTNMYIRQYPFAHHVVSEMEKQLNQWLDEGIVYESVPSATYNTPIIAVVGKKDDETGKMTKTRFCMDLRCVNSNIDDAKTDKHIIPDMEEVDRTKYIAFASKNFNKHSINWSVNRKETYAIVFAL